MAEGGLINVKSLAGAIPVLFCLAGVVAGNLPLTILGGWIPSPLYALMPIYYWCLVRPDRITPAWVFATGVLQDIMSGGPPGIWAMAFVIAYVATDRLRESLAGLAGLGAILGFAISALIASATACLTYAVYYWKALPLSPFVIQFAVTVLMYIPVVFLLGAVHRRFVGPFRSDE